MLKLIQFLILGLMFSCGEKLSEDAEGIDDTDDCDESDEDTSLSMGSVRSVSAGSSHTCGIMSDGSVDCWGMT